MKKLLLFFFIPDVIVPYTPTTTLCNGGTVSFASYSHC